MSNNAVENPGCVVFLVDESVAMESAVQDEAVGMQVASEPKSRSVSVATAINSLLKRLGGGPSFDVALVGYGTDDAGEAVVESRWGGDFAGRDFVSTQELAASPLDVVKRVRRTPNPAGIGPAIEEEVEFPIWFSPRAKGKAVQVQAYQRCADMLTDWLSTAGNNPGVPLIVHVFAAGAADGNPKKAIATIRELDWPTGAPLLVQIHLTSSKTVPATKFPSNKYYLPAGPIKDLFDRCSPVPPHLAVALRGAKVTVHENAVCMVYNARMVDVAKSLRLVEAHTKDWPAKQESAPAAAAPAEAVTPQADETPEPEPEEASAAPAEEQVAETAATEEPVETPDAGESAEGDASAEAAGADAEGAAIGTERAAVLALLLDRSVEDPYSADTQNAWARLQQRANETLSALAGKPTDAVDVVMVSYGVDGEDETEVRTQFGGPLEGETVVRDTALAEGALRVDEYDKQVPSATGGITTVPAKDHIFVELEATTAGQPQPAFAAVGDALSEWCQQHPGARVPPVVLHLTRGATEPAALNESVSALRERVPNVVLYHQIVTESPFASISYPADDEKLEADPLRAAFEVSSPLLCVDEFAAEQPHFVSAESRGVVINGKFDLLLEGINKKLG